MKIRFALFLLWCFYFCAPVFGQKNVTTQELLWVTYKIDLPLNEKYTIKQLIQERTYHSPWRQHQFVTTTAFDIQIGNGLSGNAAFTYFIQTLPHDPNISDVDNRTELRPQIELNYKNSLFDKVSLSQRFRMEFRIFEQNDGSFKYQNGRFRYRLKLTYPLTQKLKVAVHNEIHLNVGSNIVQNVFDQNRAGFGFNYALRKDLNFGIDYINWFQQRSSGVDFFNRHIVRISVGHTVQLRRKRPQ